MEEKSTLRITPQIVLGLIIIIVGVLFTLDNLDVIYARDYLRYWPVLLIGYGIVKMINPERNAGRFWGIVLTFVGSALLIDKMYFLDIRLWDFWPLILVALGAMMILRTGGKRGSNLSSIFGDAKSSESGSIVNASAFLGGSKRTVTSQDFRGGELTAFMGGVEIDLRAAAIKEKAVIDVFAFWGGIEIKVPNTWTVIFEGTPILGGYDDKTFRQGSDPQKELLIRGTIVMGGVEVTN